MKTYIVTATSVSLHAGLVQLTPEQASVRSHNLKPVQGQKGVYEIINPIELKRGEKIGLDGDQPKALLELVSTPEELEKKDKAAKAKAEEAGGKKAGGKKAAE